ncbi:MAG: tetratricopeptide repeat protein [Deltaproteobacteria bacterium]|nr:tetratricopeptide repeat protein [Deltaproteobacteria bacterium]
MRWIPTLVLFSSLLLAWPIRAQPPVAEAEKAMQSLKYKVAMGLARQIVESNQAGPEDLVKAYRILGWSSAVTGRKADAVLAFRKLLSLDPKFRLGKGVSPKIRTSFFQAVGMAVDEKPLALQHEQPVVGDRLGGLKMRVRLLADPLSLSRGLRFRYLLPSGKTRDVTVLVKGPRKVSFKLPDDYKQDSFRYWFEATNEHGAVLARAGSMEQPFELKAKAVAVVLKRPEPVPQPDPLSPAKIEEGDKTEWYATWWFWTAVGVVVAGATAGAVVAGTSGESENPLHWEVQVH